MTEFMIQRAGIKGWHKIEAITAQDAVEQHYGVIVYPWEFRGAITIFDDIRDEVDQLYAGFEVIATENGGEG